MDRVTKRESELRKLANLSLVCHMTGIKPRTFLRHVDAGLAPAGIKIGRLRRWSMCEIEAWIAGGCKPVSGANAAGGARP